ncbi:aspartate kinase [Ruminococcaceae bacterium OttesenSCG-928-N02]|nr:aspartate kinase [Ruminococcaceae bacterium OttesenSCG-928-N02]
MALIVQKFGGSSVATADKMRHVASIIAAAKQQGNDMVVVVSAQGKTTDNLIEKAGEISALAPEREMDVLLATGEQASAALLAMALREAGEAAVSLLGWQAGFKTDSSFTKAAIQTLDPVRVQKELQKGNIVVVAGFQGVDGEANITTLGRGGSDTSAVALAAVLKADKCQIYTDVEGVYTADPRFVPGAQKLEKISYDEMLELAALGAKVLNHRSVEMAKKYGVKIEVLSSMSLVPGTIVKEVLDMENLLVTGVAKDINVAAITLTGLPNTPGVASTIFEIMQKANISVDLITLARLEAEQAITFTVTAADKPKALAVLEEGKQNIGYTHLLCDTQVAKVSVVGGGMQSRPGVAAAVFKALGGHNINIQLISTSEIKISVLVAKADADEAVAAIHGAFFP